MRQIARNLELSLASNSLYDELADQRRQFLRGLPNPVERYVGLGIDSFAAKHREAAESALNGLSRIICGTAYVTNGATASVYRRGDQIIKVYRSTVAMSEDERETDKAKREFVQDELVRNLGNVAVPQTFTIAEHPLGTYRAVLGYQPYVYGPDLDLFTVNTQDLNRQEVSSFCERQSHGQADLLGLVDATFASSDSFGLVPDLNGSGNFRLSGSEEDLKLIDTDPICKTEHPAVHDHILRQAEVLEAFLSAA